jgi:hypothetical protein
VRAHIPFDRQCAFAQVPVPVGEHRFHPTRKWRFDWAWPQQFLALEVNGGAYIQGRHTRGAGFEKDCEKLSEAAVLGYRVLHVLPAQVASGAALMLVERALAGGGK